MDYEQCDPAFDCHNLKEMAGDIPCPEITEEVVLRYMEFGVQDRWGKRKPATIQSTETAERIVDALKKAVQTLGQRPATGGLVVRRAGVVVAGPGGGDFTLDLQQGTLTPGVNCESPVLRIDARKLTHLCRAADAGEDDRSSDNGRDEVDESSSLDEFILNLVLTLCTASEPSRISSLSAAAESRGDLSR